jgi:O-antigen ligase
LCFPAAQAFEIDRLYRPKTALNPGNGDRDLEGVVNRASGRAVDVLVRPAAPGALRRSARPARVQPFLLGLCGVLAVAAPLCLFFGTRGFAPVVGIAGLLCIPLARPTRQDWRGVMILSALVAWATIGVAWSPAPNLHDLHGAKTVSRFTPLNLVLQLGLSAAFVIALGRLDANRAGKALIWIAIGFLIAPLLLIEEGLTGARLYQALPALIHQPIRPDWIPADLAQASYVVAVMAWPLGVALYRRGGRIAALVLAISVPLSGIILRGTAPTVALAISFPIFVLALRRGPLAIKTLAALTALYLLATPLVMLSVEPLGLYARLRPAVPASWSERLNIWSFVARQFLHAPLRGAGLEASRTLAGMVHLHPHNAPLQLWYELGLPGAVLGTLFWLWLWRRIGDCARQDRLYGATAAATATVYLIISSISFGLWQAWWLGVGAFAMMLCMLLGRTLAPKDTD